jgi:hypothetical protein
MQDLSIPIGQLERPESAMLEQVLRTLPQWAQLKFAIQCTDEATALTRWQTVLPRHADCLRLIDQARSIATQKTENITKDFVREARDASQQLGTLSEVTFADEQRRRNETDRAPTGCLGLFAAQRLMTLVCAYDRETAPVLIREIIELAAYGHARREKMSFDAFELKRMIVVNLKEKLVRIIEESNGQKWVLPDRMPRSYYDKTAQDDDIVFPYSSLVLIRPQFGAEVLEFLRQCPEDLYRLNSREFEFFIADLFEGFGFEVELTCQSRDGGRDIVAIRHAVVNEKFLIECKRYSPNKKVGIGIVQRLHGVTAAEPATKGILATTSWFTAPASQHLSDHRWLLEGRDFDGLVNWLELYRLVQLGKQLE